MHIRCHYADCVTCGFEALLDELIARGRGQTAISAQILGSFSKPGFAQKWVGTASTAASGTSPAMGECKGAVYLSARMYAEKEYGTEAVEAAQASLLSADREALASVVAVGLRKIDERLLTGSCRRRSEREPRP